MNKQTFNTVEELKDFIKGLDNNIKYVFDVVEKDQCFELRWEPQKYYTAADGKTYPDEVWETKEGQLYQIQDMSEEHVKNCLRMIIRNNREKVEMLKTLLQHIEEHIPDDHDDQHSDVEAQTKPMLH